MVALNPGSRGEGKGEPGINCVSMRLIKATQLKQSYVINIWIALYLDSKAILFNGIVQGI